MQTCAILCRQYALKHRGTRDVRMDKYIIENAVHTENTGSAGSRK